MDGQTLVPGMHVRRVRAGRAPRLALGDQPVQPAVAQLDVVLDEGDPVGADTVGTDVASRVGGEALPSTRDADPARRGEPVEHGADPAGCPGVDDHDVVAGVGVGEQPVERRGRLRPPITGHHDDGRVRSLGHPSEDSNAKTLL